MTPNTPPTVAATPARSGPLSLDRLMRAVQRLIVPMLTLFFIAFSLFYAGAAIIELLAPILSQGDVLEGLIKGLNMGVVALAVYELAQIVDEEYEAISPGTAGWHAYDVASSAS